MSRHEKILPDGKKLTVGWDRPMGTFFAQVEKPWQTISDEVRNAIYEATKDDESRDSYAQQIEDAEARLNGDPVVLWLGGNFDEHPEIEGFVAALKKEGYEISDELKQTLIADYEADPPLSGAPDNPLVAFLRGNQQQ